MYIATSTSADRSCNRLSRFETTLAMVPVGENGILLTYCAETTTLMPSCSRLTRALHPRLTDYHSSLCMTGRCCLRADPIVLQEPLLWCLTR